MTVVAAEKGISKQTTHPNLYTVFHPNVLIGANTDLNLAESRLYSEILNFNHRGEPERLNYSVPYDLITHISDGRDITKKAAQEVLRITQSLQKRTFFLDKDFMARHFGEKHPISINPFPTIRYEDGSFNIELHPYFKGLLLRLELGFTRGDIELLRDFKHEASHRLYWLIRSVQWKFQKNTLSFDIDHFKEVLGCAGQYVDRFDNFKLRILNPIQEEFKGSWVEFEYELIKGGKGGKVKEIKLSFKSDFEIEKMLKLNFQYAWEETLSGYGLSERDIVMFRHNVAYGVEIKPGYKYDSFYIQSCVQLSLDDAKKKVHSKSKIQSFASYLYHAIKEGWWVEEIEANRAKSKSKVPVNQTNLFAPHEAKPLKVYSFPLEDLMETYEEFKKTMKINISLKDFAKQHGYIIKGDTVEKLN